MTPVVWKGNKYVWSITSSAWYGYYGGKGEGYPGDNMMVPIGLWGHLFQAASEQGVTISRAPVKSVGESDDENEDGEIKVKKVKSGGKSASKKFGKSISIFGE
jgi:hypothetical protein